MKEENLEKYPVGDMLKRLLLNVKDHNKTIFVYFLIYTITGAVYPFIAILFPKYLIDEIAGTGSYNGVLIIIGIYLGLSIVFGFLKNYIENLSYPCITKLRIDYIRDTFKKLVSIDYKYMEDAKFFEKNGRALEATSSNDNGVEGVYHKLFKLPAEVITILILTVFIGRLHFFILAGLISNILMGIYINRQVHKFQYARKEAIAHSERKKRYYYNTTHDFGYGKDIRLYQFKHRILENYDKEIHNYIGIQKIIKNREYRLGFLDLGFLLISNSLTYGILIYKVIHGMSIADFSMYLGAVTVLSLLLKTAIEQFSFILNEGQYVYDYYTFMECDMGEKGGDKKAVKNDTLEIIFDNVSFKYPDTDNYIIKNFNFTIHKGEKLAIVGINGAGKSTLVKLMTGLFDVTEGEIRINGVPIRDYNKEELFSMFSVVFQDVNILAFNITENVACSSGKVDLARVKKAIEKVGLLEKIENLPKGYKHTMLKVIEDDGVEFSGGESQKLAIARALYKNGNMVIMDEPTAALDALAEAEIYQNFSELIAGKTALYISHRLASTKFCDKIALFDRDGLKEYGSHAELMENRGDYYKMFVVQGKYYKEGVVQNVSD
ncbi:ABC transporter ATP-binding protein [Anaerocolumna cellulosilytica]|uniref:ABC transporter ATP-binding protein n=1 Tax=Anaerocolumna cellulosilytica TaxID=433286 RepID=A0A6S6QX24_9FIRM|nr:ABC transporter ATP-binding protein [Anaerocolumna cellulosilytica]MBB5196834.1 ATP-binding cassette subfamily B protein/ATP-binding cassette subfamily C protein [Anaerocolumna cellulosilytica]BCJ95773.1 ABC transporter ATP-binding protein [Anaerocolumna cellulosilytica]